jgi:hypothetical protein
MTENTSGKRSLFALLIGIDHYLPHRLPDGGYYRSLSGCVPDIERVEAFLKTRIGLPDDHVFKLSATNAGAPEPPEPKAQWPTYANVVAAFRQVAQKAQPGDQVYVHYSGHGGRQRTAFPALKGESAYDEGLVPMDIGDAQYLLDVELAHLFEGMVDEGLVLTVVLDSCHSGGAARGVGKVAVRGIPAVDEPRAAESLVAPVEELAATWQAVTRGQTRALKPGAGWLPEPVDYVLLAACRPNELAYEYEVEAGRRGGALTYWLLDALQQTGPGLNYEMVHHRVLAKVHSLFSEQTPQLQGAGGRVVFGSEHVQPPQAVTVMQVDEEKQRLQLATGQAQGVRPGTQFAIYPPDTLDFTQVERRQAVVTVAELDAASSWAGITQHYGEVPAEQGAQAVLVDPGSTRLQRAVGLYVRDDLPESVDQAAPLAAVEAALAQHGQGWVVPAGDGVTVDYQVAVNAAGEYEIWDPAGRPIINLRPALKVDEAGAATSVVQRLVHLTKYHNIMRLDNHDHTSPLLGALEVELMQPQADYIPGDPLELLPIADPGGTPVLTDGATVFLRVKNRSRQALNVTMLALQTDWAISQVHPTNQDYDTLDPGSELRVRLKASLPQGHKEGRDVLKVFATVGPVSYRWLELPVLDGQLGHRGTPTNPLEALMYALTSEQAPTRNVTAVVDPSHSWSMAQVGVCTKQG